MKLLLEQGSALCQGLLKLGICLLLIVHIGCKDSANRAKNQILFEFFRDEAYLRPYFKVKGAFLTLSWLLFLRFFLLLADVSDLHAEGLILGTDGVAPHPCLRQ